MRSGLAFQPSGHSSGRGFLNQFIAAKSGATLMSELYTRNAKCMVTEIVSHDLRLCRQTSWPQPIVNALENDY
jgi:hypothetical protein